MQVSSVGAVRLQSNYAAQPEQCPQVAQAAFLFGTDMACSVLACSRAIF